MEASVAAIAVLDSGGRIVFANSAAERLLGLKRSELVGVRYDDPGWQVTTPEGDPVPPEHFPFRLALDSGQPVQDIRHAVTGRDGVRRILSISAAPIRRDGANDEVMVVTSFVDMTEEVERGRRLEQALVEAQQASVAKSTFLANMSHEIRTPLNGVLGMAQVLESALTDPDAREMVATIRQSGEHLLHVLNDILDMSKIEAGKMTLETIPFVPAEIATAVERLHAPNAESKGLSFEAFVGTGAARPRLGDPHRLQQILNNLVGNAIKFTERGSVTLTLSARSGQPLVIEVRDTGIGMTEGQLARIFNSFEQAESGTTRRFGGTGLGMAIVRRLVEMMGGEIALASTPGQGTSVRVTLPLPETEAAEAPIEAPIDAPTGAPHGPDPPAADAAALAGRRILIADDVATNRLILARMLEGTGAILTFAANGAEAIAARDRLVREGTPPDVLILDISMPVMDGKEALAVIRSRPDGDPALPAIALTANALSHQIAEYRRAGFDAHLAKPFRKAELIRCLATLLRERISCG
jgi:PAS domain S-box-containing protein